MRVRLRYVELWDEGEASKRAKKTASKTRYSCPDCGTNAWAKPDTRLICGDCEKPMESEQAEGDESADAGELEAA